MRTTSLCTLALSVLASGALAQDRESTARDAGQSQLAHFTFRTVEYAAPSLERVWAEYGIYLPAGYDDAANAKRVYPWVIWLHGRNEDHRRFYSGAAAVVDRLRGAGEIPEMIIVAPSAGGRALYFNGERDGDLEDLIVKDLTKAVEKEFRVSKQREDRAIMGISMGGFGAFRFAFKHPDVFGTVAAHSSAMFPADPAELDERYLRAAQGISDVLGDPIDPQAWAREVPTAMVARLKPKDLNGLRIWFDVGTRDRYGFEAPNVALHEALDKAGIAHTFELVEDGGHSWGSGFKDSSIEHSFKFVAAGFERAAPQQPAKKQG